MFRNKFIYPKSSQHCLNRSDIQYINNIMDILRNLIEIVESIENKTNCVKMINGNYKLN